jgi:hypothetical protein
LPGAAEDAGIGEAGSGVVAEKSAAAEFSAKSAARAEPDAAVLSHAAAAGFAAVLAATAGVEEECGGVGIGVMWRGLKVGRRGEEVVVEVLVSDDV